MEGEIPLESWKEITAYLRCSRRTCLRWERDLGLPVHRLDETPKARVYAYRSELDTWRQRRLSSPDSRDETSAVLRRRAKKSRFLIPVGGVLFAAGVGAMIVRPSLPPLLPVPDDKPLIAVLPFQNLTGEPAWNVWETALADLIITDLTQSRFLGVVRVPELARSLSKLGLDRLRLLSPGDLQRIADSTGADFLVVGSILRSGRDLTVNVSPTDRKTGVSAAAISATLRGPEGVFDAADDLARSLKKATGLDRKHISRDMDRRVSRVSTDRPDAFLSYSRGLRLAGTGQTEEGIVRLREAVDLDPKFGLAYKYLWRACLDAQRRDDEKSFIRKAVEHADRLSERERGDVEVLYYQKYRIDPGREREALERLWRYHPDDRFAALRMMQEYCGREEWAKALPMARKGLAANRHEVLFFEGLARCQANLDLFDEAVGTISDFIGSNPGHYYWADALKIRSQLHSLQGEFALALADLETVTRRFPNSVNEQARAKCQVLIRQGDLAAAEREVAGILASGQAYEKADALMIGRDIRLLQGRLRDGEDFLMQGLKLVGEFPNDVLMQTLRGGLYLEWADLHRLSGKFDEALKDLEAAVELPRRPAGSSPPLEVLNLKALILLDKGDAAAFDRQVDEITSAVAKRTDPKLTKIAYELQGRRELLRGDARKAVAHLAKAVDLESVPGAALEGADPAPFLLLAEAYTRLGEGSRQQALSLYEKAVSTACDHVHCGDLYVRGLARLAAAYETLSRSSEATADAALSCRAKAIRYYRMFIAYWKDADPVFEPEVAEAVRRLAALGAS